MAIRGVSLLDMDFSKEFPFGFAIQSYGCTKLNVMYTNDTDVYYTTLLGLQVHRFVGQ